VPDIIQLLPDNIANQIAAGEVIQRPASAVKELLENAVDAAATEIKLIVIDAGKNLIQVVDNGKGMSETDARMSFERHATSKISNIEDLFKIKTMGFRGEALASIAAVAQVELKTRKANEEIGTCIEIENSIVKKQEPCSASAGTNIGMKNLFFNVPARRNFLKSNAAELRHIIDEFIRVAMAFPPVFFSLTSNGQQVFHLEAGSIKQRILQLLGTSYSSKLVSVSENTDYMNVYGFVGKPETAKKTRGDQYFFVNNRFIKSAYLNHAVMNAFGDMIARDSFPLYVLFIDLDPSQLDINVHPTKQEIKFEDEKIVYAFVQAAVKHALAQFSIAPSLDFSLNADIQQMEAISKPANEERLEAISTSNLFKTFTQKNQAHKIEGTNRSELKHWKDFYEPAEKELTVDSWQLTDKQPGKEMTVDSWQLTDKQQPNDQSNNIDYTVPKRATVILNDVPLTQIHQTYIVAQTSEGFLLIHQQQAHERILYERLSEAVNGKQMPTQRSLFPYTIELSAADSVLIQELLPDLKVLGYLIEPFGNNTFVVQGTPADILQGNEKMIIELLLEQYKHFTSDIKFSKREKLVRCVAKQQAIKSGKTLAQKEMTVLAEELFDCKVPNITPNGSPTYLEFKGDNLERMFGR
jgi:DNA mismatch repair protein MutL